jgi:hypothetical protein
MPLKTRRLSIEPACRISDGVAAAGLESPQGPSEHSCQRCGTQAALKLLTLPSVDSAALAIGLAVVSFVRWSFPCQRPDPTGRAI